MEDRSRWGDRTLYFLLGGLVGATVALLFAPRSGEETRGLIVDKVKEGKDALRDRLHQTCDTLSQAREKLGGQTRELIDRGKEIVTTEKEVLGAAIEAGKQAYRDEKTRRQG